MHSEPVAFTEIQRREMVAFSDRFRVSEQVLGVGGNARVFLAVNRLEKRQVACKVVPVHKTQTKASVRGQACDSKAAAEVARFLGTKHHAFTFDSGRSRRPL